MPENFSALELAAIILSVGALGAASYGVVDNFKLSEWLSLAGFDRLFSARNLRYFRIFTAQPYEENSYIESRDDKHWQQGDWKFLNSIEETGRGIDPLLPALRLSYGNSVMEMMKVQYISGRGKSDLPRTIRQGVRIGLDLMDEKTLKLTVEKLGLYGIADQCFQIISKNKELRALAAGMEKGDQNKEKIKELELAVKEEHRTAIARLETTIDSRIDASFVLAEEVYAKKMRLCASGVSVAISVAVGSLLAPGNKYLGPYLLYGILVGLAAVPMAPIAKDLSTAVQEAAKAYRVK